MVLNLKNSQIFNNRTEIYQAREYEKNYFLVERNNNYQIIRFNSTLEKVVKLAYYVLNPFFYVGINPFKSTSNVEKRFEASLIESKEVMKKTLPQLREEFYTMVSNAKKDDLAQWYKNFNAMRLENQKRLLSNYENLDLLLDLSNPCQTKIKKCTETIAEIDQLINLLEEAREQQPRDSKSLQDLSQEIERARMQRDFLVQQKDIYEIDQASKEFEAEINNFFKDKVNTLILDFYNSSRFEKLDKGAELLIFAEALATATVSDNILDYETEKKIWKQYKSILGNAEKKEIKTLRKDDPNAFQKELIAFLFRSIETHYKQMHDEMTSGNTLQNIATFVELHRHEQENQFLTPFYKTWSIRTKIKGHSPIMRSAHQAAAALRGLYQKPRELSDWAKFLVREEQKRLESAEKLREQIEKDGIDLEQRGQELDLTHRAMNLFKELDGEIVKKFAGNGFSPFYAFLIQLIDNAKNNGEGGSFEKEALDSEDLQNLGFRKTSTLTLTHGIYLFCDEFRELVLAAKKMAHEELTRLRDPQSYRQILGKLEKNNLMLQQHPEHPKYQNRIASVQSEIAKHAQFLVDWYQKSEGYVFRPQDLSVDILKEQFLSLQNELIAAKQWKPSSFDFFSDTSILADENKKKIEDLTELLKEFTLKFVQLRSLIDYRDLLLKNDTLTKQIAIEKESIHHLSGARIETLIKYIDLLNKFEESATEAMHLRERNPSQDIAEAIKNAQLAKVRLENSEIKLNDEIKNLSDFLELKEKFNRICNLLHLE